MRIELTGERLRGVRMAIRGTPWEDRVEELLPAPLEGRNKRAAVIMPPAAWSRVLDCLEAACFNERGARRGDIKVSMVKAMQVIAKAVLARQHHPAFRGKSVVGWSPISIPCWTRVGPDETLHWAVLDDDPDDFVMLWMVPEHESWRGMRITTWSPRVGLPPPGCHGELLDEATHLRFARQ